MEKRVLKHVEGHRYTLIGYTPMSSELYYLHMFLGRLDILDIKNGASAYNKDQLGSLMIDYGKNIGEDFYIAFWDWDNCQEGEIEFNGIKAIDDTLIKKLKLTYENFDDIFKAWIKILEVNFPYLILTQHDSGWVDMQGKYELSLDEQMLVEEFAQKYKS